MQSEVQMTRMGVEFTRDRTGRMAVVGPVGTSVDLATEVSERVDMVRAWLLANERGERPNVGRRHGECESCHQEIPDHRGGNCWICCCTIQKILDERNAQAEFAKKVEMQGMEELLRGLSGKQQEAAVELLRDLNPEQREVAMHDQGPCMVNACAGSGKTTAVVRRMAYLVRVRGVSSERIFGTTFSRKAASEMNHRIRNLLGFSTMVQVQTFHAFCRRLLSEEFSGFDGWQLDEHDRYRDAIKRAIGYEFLDWKKADVEEVTQYIELAKAAAIWPGTDDAAKLAMSRYRARPTQQRRPDLMAQAYEMTEKLRSDARLMTFSDWMMEAEKLLREEPIRARWAALFDHVMVDEAQDNSLVQMRIASHLARDHRNLMIVGDAAQSIYKWRGAAPEYFNGFPGEWGAKIISMFRNYRSAKPVIDLANTILREMQPGDRVGNKDMECEKVEAPGAVSVHAFETGALEAEGVVGRIAAMHEDGVPWKRHLVLYRVNALSRAVEEELNRHEIPYKITGSSCFYLRREIVTLLAYLKVAWRKTATMDDVRRTLYTPKRMLGKAFWAQVEAASRSKPASFSDMVEVAIAASGRINDGQMRNARRWGKLIDQLRQDIATTEAQVSPDGTKQLLPPCNPSKLLDRVVAETDYVQWLKNEEGRETPDNDRVSNVAELVRLASQFKDAGAFLKHAVDQIHAAKSHRDDESTGGDHVTLMSIHRAKGLEWPHVHLITCNEGVMPHAYADDVEEERRIFYVATTRAMESLDVSHVEYRPQNGELMPMRASRFICGLIAQGAPERLPEMSAAKPSDPAALLTTMEADAHPAFDDSLPCKRCGGDSRQMACEACGGTGVETASQGEPNMAKVIPLFGPKDES